MYISDATETMQQPCQCIGNWFNLHLTSRDHWILAVLFDGLCNVTYYLVYFRRLLRCRDASIEWLPILWGMPKQKESISHLGQCALIHHGQLAFKIPHNGAVSLLTLFPPILVRWLLDEDVDHCIVC